MERSIAYRPECKIDLAKHWVRKRPSLTLFLFSKSFVFGLCCRTRRSQKDKNTIYNLKNVAVFSGPMLKGEQKKVHEQSQKKVHKQSQKNNNTQKHVLFFKWYVFFMFLYFLISVRVETAILIDKQ